MTMGYQRKGDAGNTERCTDMGNRSERTAGQERGISRRI